MDVHLKIVSSSVESLDGIIVEAKAQADTTVLQVNKVVSLAKEAIDTARKATKDSGISPMGFHCSTENVILGCQSMEGDLQVLQENFSTIEGKSAQHLENFKSLKPVIADYVQLHGILSGPIGGISRGSHPFKT